MGLNKIKTIDVNQNGYNKNTSTPDKIGALFTYPVDYNPDDCLPCDGFVLNKDDYSKLYQVIGDKFNAGTEAPDEFRIPDFNISGRFLQPGENPGVEIEAGLPNIVGISGADSICNPSNTYIGRGIPTGPFYYSGRAGYNVATQGGTTSIHVALDLSRANPIYGNSPTVQPLSQIVHMCIKYK